MKSLFLLLTLIGGQDVPQDIPKSELPKLAVCVICDANGAGHGQERPVAGVRYKGQSYYFCNSKEVKEFKADPEAFMPPVLPRAMPEMKVVDTTGKTWDAAAFKGKTVLIDFWATWCGPCKELMPRLEKVQKAHGGPAFTILSISIDEKRATMEAFLKKKPMANPVAWDEFGAWQAWRIRAIPALFLIKDGVVVEQWTGKPAAGALEAAVEKAIKG